MLLFEQNSFLLFVIFKLVDKRIQVMLLVKQSAELVLELSDFLVMHFLHLLANLVVLMLLSLDLRLKIIYHGLPFLKLGFHIFVFKILRRHLLFILIDLLIFGV